MAPAIPSLLSAELQRRQRRPEVREARSPSSELRLLSDRDASGQPADNAEILAHILMAPSRRCVGAGRSAVLLSRSMRRRASFLGGDGPDELIGGYPSHHKFARAYRTTAKRLSTVRSMQHFNLDRTNKMGMAHSKEYRAPFLESTLSQRSWACRFRSAQANLPRHAPLLHGRARRESSSANRSTRPTSLPSRVFHHADYPRIPLAPEASA
jgi:hypothetical protein